MATPTKSRVDEYFNYDPETGVFTIKERPRSDFSLKSIYSRHLSSVGKRVGSVNSDGYVKLHMDGGVFSAHRVAWLIVNGEWVEYPEFEIDHENGDPSDNRISNLRKCTKSENQRNAGRRRNNTSSVHGVNWKAKSNNGGRWVARIWNGPLHVYLGSFKTLYEAQIARKAAERVLGYTGSDRNGYPVNKIAALRGEA